MDQDINTPVKRSRLASLDALRGFDMFWIIGGEGIFHALAKLTGWSIFLAMSYQLEHSEWHGFRFYDMIFPLFLFLAGVSMPYSLNKRIERGDSKQKIYLHVFRRMILLVFFGMVYNGFFKFEWETMRYASVLGHIGLGWFFAALIFLNYNKRGQYLWFFGILIGYWLMMVLIPVPGYGAGNLTMEGSLAGYVDRHLLPGRLYMGIHDPEGLLSTIPSIATALLGVLAGHYLRTEKIRTTKLKKGLMIGITGILTLLAGLFWSIFFPINKDLWTSSFVLFSGGWSLILLSLFYLVIDVWNHRRWAFFFIIIGLNPITIYMCQAGIISFSGMSDFFFGGLISYFPEAGHDVLKAIGYTIMSWLFLYFLYRQKIFLKV